MRGPRHVVEVSVSYCEIPEFYYETFPKARKPYRCVECSAPIEVGEKHLYYRMKFDGDFDHARQHMVCRELCMLLRDEFNDFECIGFGSLHEEWENFDFGDRDDKQKKARSLYAAIKWRERKHRTRRWRQYSTGLLFQKKWGHPAEVVPEDRP